MDFEGIEKFTLRTLEETLPDILTYHNAAHTREVIAACKEFATAENVKGDDLAILLTAAAMHDTGFLTQYKKNEVLACAFAEKELPQFGCDESEISKICRIIMATSIPQKPSQDILEKIICDADLSYLGTESFFEKADLLRKELAFQDITYTDKDWLKFELDFMETHSYFTEAARTLRGPDKTRNTEKLRSLSAS